MQLLVNQINPLPTQEVNIIVLPIYLYKLAWLGYK
jgi:hypothetical protein